MSLEFILPKISDKKIGVFIDDSNLYHAQKNAGWRVDWEKFKKILAEHCEILIYNYYVAVPDKSDSNYRSTMSYLKYVREYAEIKTKPVKYVKTAKVVSRKGDVDVEIVLDVVRNIGKLDVVFVVSGDSDYLELKNWAVRDKKKNIVFVSFESNMAWELRKCWHIYLNRIREEIELEIEK